MKEISLNELKRLQLQILTAVDNFCRSSNIKYSLAFGTLLGAVRHKGYIPWDDDIDVMMPRDDYEYFMKTFRHPRYFTLTYQKEPKFVLPYGKVIDNDTILIEDSSMKYPIGVNIDVFPIDTGPERDNENFWFKKKLLIDTIYTIRKLRIDSERSATKNLIVVLTKILTFPLSLRRLCCTIQKEATRFNDQLYPERKGVLSTGDTKLRWLMPADIFKEYTDITFEDNLYRSIKNTDVYLTATYGDYMQFPPKEKRIAHHGFKAYWK